MMPFNVINFKNWIEEHRDLLKPPVGNKMIWKDRDFIVMVVGGPNERSDYHTNKGEEFFYQLEGNMNLKMMINGKPEDFPIKEGEIFLLPPNVPHSPQREANSVGLVIERKRRKEELDGLMWYCQECNHQLYKEEFYLENIEEQFGGVFQNFFGNIDHRTCDKCGAIHPEK